MNLFPSIRRNVATLAGIALATLSFVSNVQANLLVNAGFEAPTLPKDTYSIMDDSKVPGWNSTASDQKIEVWSTPFNGVSAFEGNQFAEIDANMQEALYQDVTGITAGARLTFGLAHRGRATVESIRFTITDLGIDGIYGTADDATLFAKTYADGTGAWGYYSSATEAAIISKGDTVRVSYASLTPGSVGNFLDAVSLNATPTALAPEPGTWAALALLCFATFGRTPLRRMSGLKA